MGKAERVWYTVAAASVIALFLGYVEWYVVLVAVVSLPTAAVWATTRRLYSGRFYLSPASDVEVHADEGVISFRRGWCRYEYVWEAIREIWQ